MRRARDCAPYLTAGRRPPRPTDRGVCRGGCKCVSRAAFPRRYPAAWRPGV